MNQDKPTRNEAHPISEEEQAEPKETASPKIPLQGTIEEIFKLREEYEATGKAENLAIIKRLIQKMILAVDNAQKRAKAEFPEDSDIRIIHNWKNSFAFLHAAVYEEPQLSQLKKAYELFKKEPWPTSRRKYHIRQPEEYATLVRLLEEEYEKLG